VNNIYLQIIQVWLYLHEVLKTNQKGYGMAGKPQKVSELLDIDLAKLPNEESANDKVAEVMRIVDTLDYPELLRLRDLIGQEYTQKAEAAKARGRCLKYVDPVRGADQIRSG
jgi:hypothetical protein